MTNTQFDVIIIGGSYAGLSAAMSLGRSLRTVLVIDSGKPCNAPTPHSHNFLTHDGNTPAAISAIAREQVEKYNTVTFIEDVAVEATKQNDQFEIALKAGKKFTTTKLIFATGIKDQLLDIKGLADCWGKSVIHCPYCHGYEFHSQRTAALATGETALHYAMLVGNLTKDLTILTNGKHDFSTEQLSKFKAHNIAVVETPVQQIIHEKGQVKEVEFTDGNTLSFDAVYFRPEFVQHSDLPAKLGCELTEQGHIKVDSMQKTTVPGIFACGDNASPMRAVANAVSTGNFAGAVVNRELASERF